MTEHDYHRHIAEENARLREALRVAREAYSRPHLVYREATEDGMIVLRVTERVWRNALAAIDAALKGEMTNSVDDGARQQ